MLFSMKKYVVIVIILLGIVSLGTLTYFRVKKPVESASVAQEAPVEDVVRECAVSDTDIIGVVNRYRSDVGVNPLVFDKKLDDYAGQRALEQNGVLDSHVGLRGSADALGYQLVGEDQNLMIGPKGTCWSGETWIKNFKSSSAHWTSLMNPRYDEIGVGFYKNVLNINLGDK